MHSFFIRVVAVILVYFLSGANSSVEGILRASLSKNPPGIECPRWLYWTDALDLPKGEFPYQKSPAAVYNAKLTAQQERPAEKQTLPTLTPMAPFRAGQPVHSRQYGDGKVIGYETGSNGEQDIVFTFEDHGKKTFRARMIALSGITKAKRPAGPSPAFPGDLQSEIPPPPGNDRPDGPLAPSERAESSEVTKEPQAAPLKPPPARRREKRADQHLQARIARTQEVAAENTIVEALVSAGFSKTRAREKIANWPSPEETWNGIVRTRDELMAEGELSPGVATRLAMDESPRDRLAQLRSTAARLRNFWREDEVPEDYLYRTDGARVEERLKREGVPNAVAAWCLAPLRGDVADDGGPSLWFQRLTTLEELRTVLRSGALRALPDEALDPGLEKALIQELARKARRTPQTLEDNLYLSFPLLAFRTPTGPNKKLAPITLAPLHRRYAALSAGQPQAVHSVSEFIAQKLWPEETAAFHEAQKQLQDEKRESLDQRLKRLYDRSAAEVRRITARLYEEALKRWKKAEAKAEQYEERKREMKRKAAERPAPAPKPERRLRPLKTPVVPPTPEPEPDYSLSPEVFRRIPADSGMQEKALPEVRAAIEAALTALEQSPPAASAMASLTLIQHRQELTYSDLFRIVRVVSEGRVQDPAALDGIGIALQRRWDGIDIDLRSRLNHTLVQAAARGDLDPARATAMRRPIFSSLSSDEKELSIPPDLSASWRSMTLTDRLRWIRIASRKVRTISGNRLFADYNDVRLVLGIEQGLFRKTFPAQQAETAALSIELFMTEDHVQCWVYFLRDDPAAVLYLEDLIQKTGSGYDSFMGLAKRRSHKMEAVYLAERFHIFTRKNLNNPTASERKRLIYNRLGRKHKPERAEVLGAAAEIDAYLKSRPILPQNPASLRSYFQENAMSLTLDRDERPSAHERALVVDMIQRLAQSAWTTVKRLELTDYLLVNVQLRDRSSAMNYFYVPMDRMNDTDYSTSYDIRVRYGLQKALPPLSDLKTIEQYKAALHANAFPDQMPWEKLSRELKVALVRELMFETGKPAIWLTDKDYEYVTLRRLSTPDKPYTLRSFYLYYAMLNVSNPRKTMPLFIGQTFGLIPPLPGVFHAAQTLQTSQDLKEALDNDWITLIPWGFLSFFLIDQFMREVATAARRSIETLTARHFEQVPIPSLSTKNKVTGKMEGPKLRGLFAHYAARAPKGKAKLAFLRKQIAAGLEKERRRLQQGLRHPRNPKAAAKKAGRSA